MPQLLTRSWPFDPTRYAPPRHRRACRYVAYVPDRLADVPVRLDASLAAAVSEAERGIAALNVRPDPALVPFSRLLLRTESIASSKVEGLQVGARELARAEAKRESGEKIGPTALEILANIEAMVAAVHSAATAPLFTPEHLLDIHRRLMEHAAHGRSCAGVVRTTQNWIGGNDHTPCGADFVPPPPEFVSALLGELCEVVNDGALPPLVQAALVHAQFETIHPFDDGNGRTGRALLHVVLRRRGLAPHHLPPISLMLAADRARYVAALEAFRAGRVAAWLEYVAVAATTSARLAVAYREALAELRRAWRARLEAVGAPRSDAAAWVLIDALPAHPVLTAAAALAATGRSKPQVYEAITRLEDAGVLHPLGEGRRNRSWEPDGLIELLEAFEAARPVPEAFAASGATAAVPAP